ncbi:microcin C transport system permease protein [Arboricoccus pini]|uniref:Microcin C transport system permease protein n=1 Tax=Arboricoccus pini TaxID=1963835 RepID=A0A212R508_9PROT|nr:microcin C ABC transporter permease YejB [Arboricoccus pini]SNB67056.1 microcin C transport system permease protein [Arboricoccus pini]
MAWYIARRLVLMIPTLLGIMILNFLIVQAAPGGPIEQIIADLSHQASAGDRFSGGSGDLMAGAPSVQSSYRGAQGLDPQFIDKLKRQFGFDKPLIERFWQMMRGYLIFDLGQSFYSNRSVQSLIVEKLPVSISLGLWTTLLVYLVSIPLGIRKAVRDGEPFDLWTSVLVVVGNAVPSFLFALLLIVIFAGGSYLEWFPLRGLVSDNWQQMSWPSIVLDYFWHITLPVLAMVIGGFASLTMLTRNSFLDQLGQQYVMTARAKGLSENQVLYRHVFRNAMLIVVAGFPAAFVSILFTGSLLIETMFSLDGLGLLGFEAAIRRDYPVMFGTLFIFTLIGLILKLVSDLTYLVVDPRIDFEARRI